MTRILELQKIETNQHNLKQPDSSTSSNSGCACSTRSAALCYIGDDFVAI